MNFLKKNQVIVYAIALMLVVAGYLNYTASDDNNYVQTSMQMEAKDDTQIADIGDATLVSSNDIVETNSVSETQNDYFVKSKLERDAMYSQMLETYEKILNSNNSMETQKQTATQEITKINGIKNRIMICENLIRTKGFEESVIFVNDDSISVIIKAKELEKEDVAQVQNIISREMQAEIENIHISNK